MAFCPNCNTTIVPDAESCAQCGATFGPGSAWKPGDQVTTSEPEHYPWKLTFFAFLLLGNIVFIGVHDFLDLFPWLSRNSSPEIRIGMYAVICTFEYMVAFVVGSILSILYGFAVGQRGKAYRRLFWMRALALTSIPALLVIGFWWWGTRLALRYSYLLILAYA